MCIRDRNIGIANCFRLQTEQLLGLEPKTVGDPYVLMRSAYEQRRRYEINDGIVVDLFLDDPFLDDPSVAE